MPGRFGTALASIVSPLFKHDQKRKSIGKARKNNHIKHMNLVQYLDSARRSCYVVFSKRIIVHEVTAVKRWRNADGLSLARRIIA
jgi:hypothetical protein